LEEQAGEVVRNGEVGTKRVARPAAKVAWLRRRRWEWTPTVEDVEGQQKSMRGAQAGRHTSWCRAIGQVLEVGFEGECKSMRGAKQGSSRSPRSSGAEHDEDHSESCKIVVGAVKP
jgi:hypothetical protein